MGWMAPAPGVEAPRWSLSCKPRALGATRHGYYNDRPRPGQERLSSSRNQQRRRGGRSPSAEAGADDPVLQQAGALPGWDRGLRDEPPLGAGAGAAGPPGSADAAGLRQGLKRGKTDAADAEAICEAVSRPTMRFVAIKSVDQQAALSLHRARDLLVRQRTQLVNLVRGLLAEFGVNIPRGITHALAFARRIVAGEAQEVPELAAKVVGALAAQALAVQDQVRGLERELMAWYRASALARRIATVPGVGLLGATALAATVPAPGQFRSGRQFAAWLGLTPRLNSSGGKERLGRISKMGDRYLRRLLIVGMTSLVGQA